MDNLRVKLKLGDREFEAEGQTAAVEARWAEARDLLFQDRAKQESPATPVAQPGIQGFHSLFDLDRGRRTIRLRVLPPRGEILQRLANSLMVLLHGYHDLLERAEVPVTRMADDLRMSGFAGLKRLSRAFERLEQEGLATRSGAGKGTRYRLTNPGLEAARALSRSFSK